MSLLFELPVLSTHGTLLLLLLWVEPLHYTVYMKAVSAFSPHQGAVITRCATVRATCFKWHSTYTTRVVIRYPLPCTDCCPVLDLYFHSDLLWIIRRVSLKQGKQIVCSVSNIKNHWFKFNLVRKLLFMVLPSRLNLGSTEKFNIRCMNR